MALSDTFAAPRPYGWLRRIDSGALLRMVGLYLVLAAYMAGLTYILAVYLSGPYAYFRMTFDNTRLGTYVWICILTPLTILPAGLRLETASQFIFPIFMTFVGMSSPIFLVQFVTADIFWYFYFCLFISYLMLGISTRIVFRPIPSPFSEKKYVALLTITLLAFVAVFAAGMVQNFHIVSFSQLYDIRTSDEQSASPLIQRFAVMYIFSFGGFFFGLCMLYRKVALSLLFLAGYVICYGLVQFKTALLAPLWIIYLYLNFRYFNKNSTIKFYIALTFPFWVGVAIYLLFPTARGTLRSLTGVRDIALWGYMNLVLFRQYAVTADALGLYYNFFQSHTFTFWSQITGVDFFLHYPYGDTIAIEMQNRYGLGNYNASFLATEGVASYGYQAIPLASAVVATLFMLLNTAARGIPPRILVVMMVMPCLMLNERPLGTSLLTGGILFLLFYLAWLPRQWIAARPPPV